MASRQRRSRQPRPDEGDVGRQPWRAPARGGPDLAGVRSGEIGACSLWGRARTAETANRQSSVNAYAARFVLAGFAPSVATSSAITARSSDAASDGTSAQPPAAASSSRRAQSAGLRRTATTNFALRHPDASTMPLGAAISDLGLSTTAWTFRVPQTSHGGSTQEKGPTVRGGPVCTYWVESDCQIDSSPEQ